MSKIKLMCNRCLHSWVRRELKHMPKQCPKCRSPYWNKERVRFAGDGNRGGRP